MNSENNNEWLNSLTRLAAEFSVIDSELYAKFDVKRGLRDIRGQGVLTGLTEIGEVHAYIMEENKLVPCAGKLYYRGYDVEELVEGIGDWDDDENNGLERPSHRGNCQ